MQDEVLEELFVRGCKQGVYYSMVKGKIPKEAGESLGREAQQQALAQEVQQLRKALQENCALQRRLAASAQGGGQGRALERKRRRLTREADKLKDRLAERGDYVGERPFPYSEGNLTTFCAALGSPR